VRDVVLGIFSVVRRRGRGMVWIDVERALRELWLEEGVYDWL